MRQFANGAANLAKRMRINSVVAVPGLVTNGAWMVTEAGADWADALPAVSAAATVKLEVGPTHDTGNKARERALKH
jgi:hypothetical protein